MQKKVILVFLILFFTAIFLTFAADSYFTPASELQISPETEFVQPEDEKILVDNPHGIYSSSFYITCSTGKEGTIYYTTNCETPSPSSEDAHEYTSPIWVESEETSRTIIYKFKAYYVDGTESDTYTHTYFVGDYADERYNSLILSISGEPDDLFGYENGIFVKGQLWDEFWAENPDYDYLPHDIPANYHMRGIESERTVHMELFDSTGAGLLSQNCGIRIHGGWSRYNPQKSFTLYARKEYDLRNKFDYPFFPDARSAYDASIIDEYKRVLVRNSGNDNGKGFVRDALVSVLAKQAGFPDVQSVQPISVYINSEYYGFYWLQTQYCSDYFTTKYGEHEGSFVIVANDGNFQMVEVDEDPLVVQYATEYNDLCEKFALMDLTDEQSFQELCSYFDIENFLQYMALECYVGNKDWPHNNTKAYRYVSPDQTYHEGSVFDGRFRYLLFDTDYAFGLLYMGSYGDYADTRHLSDAVNEKVPLLRAVLQRDDCRQYFVNYLCDLMNGVMTFQNVSSTLNYLSSRSEAEIAHSITETTLFDDTSLYGNEVTMSSLATDYTYILNFATGRPASIHDQMQELFGVTGLYNLTVSPSGNDTIIINDNLHITEPFVGAYYNDNTVTLSCTPAPGRQFAYWLINGEIYTQEEIEINASLVTNDIAAVELITVEQENAPLIITQIKSKGNNDYIVLTNPSSHTIRTLGYYLTDDPESLKKFAIPITDVNAGETLVLYGSNYSGLECLGQIGLNFNLKDGETLILSKGDAVLESVLIPNMAAEESIYQKDMSKGTFFEILPSAD